MKNEFPPNPTNNNDYPGAELEASNQGYDFGGFVVTPEQQAGLTPGQRAEYEFQLTTTDGLTTDPAAEIRRGQPFSASGNRPFPPRPGEPVTEIYVPPTPMDDLAGQSGSYNPDGVRGGRPELHTPVANLAERPMRHDNPESVRAAGHLTLLTEVLRSAR